VNTIKLENNSQIIAAVPMCVGFKPENSIVLMAFDKGKLIVSARFDIEDEVDAAIAFFVMKTVQYDPSYIAAVYDDESMDRWIELSDLGRLLVCHKGEWFAREHGAFTPVTVDPVEARFVEIAFGRVSPAETRTQLVSRIRGGDDKFDEYVIDADIAPLVGYQEALHKFSTGQYEWFAAYVQNIRVRDALLKTFLESPDQDDVIDKLIECVSRAQLTQVSMLCSLLGGVAYGNGQGAIANIAVDYGIENGVGLHASSLLMLLNTALSAAMPPQGWVEVVTSMDYATILAG
jgi:hypothetical protein